MNPSIKCGLLTCVLNTGLQLYYRSLYIAGLGSGYSGCVFPLPSVFVSFLVQQKTRIHKATKQLSIISHLVIRDQHLRRAKKIAERLIGVLTNR